MISVRRSAGRSRGYRGSTPSSRLRSRASRIARNLRLIESLLRYGIGGNLARFGCNLTRSVYLMLGLAMTVATSMTADPERLAFPRLLVRSAILGALVPVTQGDFWDVKA